MTRADLLALAARVEAAQGADRVLDAEIVCAARGYTIHEQTDPARGHFAFWHGKPWESLCTNCTSWPAFTASLDAAASLVPKGWRVAALIQDWHDNWRAHLMVKSGKAGGFKEVNVLQWSASATLALTAAVLRAMAEEAGE